MHVPILLVGILGLCSAVDIKLAEEGKCIRPAPETVPFNAPMFLDKSVTLYVPLLSKYDMFRQVEDLTGEKKFKELSEVKIKKSCLTFSAVEQGVFCTRAFDDFEACYQFGPGEKDSFVWKAKGQKDWEGESWVTKADKDYFLTVNCWANGQKSFAVNAIKPTLDVEVMEDIKEHLMSLGFNSEYFLEVDYKNCDTATNRKEL